tara:strand:- start:43 stop:987 length:945 start_codon:yes stop_codon:yes gene_type:complete
MGFLDNSGDIILDVVLTDNGRKLLARGDGSFQITKFALGDEEIDYSLYDKTNASGSSYYDLEILQTPILEAFTDNAASMKSQLQTYSNLELLFLPVLRLNERVSINERASNGVFYVTANRETSDNDGSSTTTTGVGRNSDGVINQGFLFGESLVGTIIKIDEGLDTTEISPKRKLDDELKETSYIVQIDNRLGRLVDTSGTLATPDYIDDDNIAYYTVDLGDTYVTDITDDTNSPSEVIQGPRGTSLSFRIQTSMDVNTSSYLFTTLGATTTLTNRTSGGATTSSVYYIDSNIRVTGVKTGCMIDVPVRYVRLA